MLQGMLCDRHRLLTVIKINNVAFTSCFCLKFFHCCSCQESGLLDGFCHVSGSEIDVKTRSFITANGFCKNLASDMNLHSKPCQRLIFLVPRNNIMLCPLLFCSWLTDAFFFRRRYRHLRERASVPAVFKEKHQGHLLERLASQFIEGGLWKGFVLNGVGNDAEIVVGHD